MIGSIPIYAGAAVLLSTTALATILCVPAVRKFTFGSVDHNWLAGELEFDRIDQDNRTIVLKKDSLARVIRIEGMQYDTLSIEAQQNMLKIRSTMFFTLGQLGITARLFSVKRQADFSYQADYPTPVLSEIGNQERSLYSRSYDLQWFIMLSNDNYGKLDKACEHLYSMLRDYRPKVIEGNGLLAFVNYLLSGEYSPEKTFPETKNISAAVHGSDISFAKDTGVIQTTTPSHHYSKILSIVAWPDLADGMFAGDIMALHGDIELCQILKPQGIDKSKAQLITNKQEQESFPSFIQNVGLLEEVSGVIELINDGKTVVYETEYMICIRAKSLDALDLLQRHIGDILSKRRIQWSIDTGVAPSYWFNRMPYNNNLARPLRLLNQNIAALWTFHNSASGQKTSPWGDKPLRLFKSGIGKIYNFNFHTSDEENTAGHFLVFAPTGGGKSTLMMHLLGGLAKLNKVRSYIFDSKEGARFMVEGMGGNYQNIENLQLNPFHCEDTQTNRLHLSRLLRQMGRGEDSEISLLLNTVFNLEFDQRSLSNVFNYVFNETGSSAYADYQRWAINDKGVVGNYAHIFNHEIDSLSDVLGSSFMTAINMADILSDDVLAPPLVTHIMDSISRQAQTNHHGFCVFVDEAAALLRNKAFAQALLVMYREYRKLNGVVGMAFQDPQALLDSGIAEPVLSNTTTMVFFPNADAKSESFQALGLTPEQLDLVTGSSSYGLNRAVLIVKRNPATGLNESIVLDVDLSHYGDCMRWYRNGTKANNELDELKAQWGEEWRLHV